MPQQKQSLARTLDSSDESSEEEYEEHCMDVSDDEISDEDQDAECIYCAGLFSDDHDGEDWIRCTEHKIAELMVCRACLGSLAGYLKFATICVTTEDKITKYCKQIDTIGQDLVELNHVRTFCNDNKSDILKKLTLSENSEVFGVKSVPCVVQQKMCYKTNQNNLKTDILNHEVEIYKCETCHFKTKHKRNLKSHVLVHREYSEVEMYSCEKCSFKTKLKRYLKNHLLNHMESSKAQIYTCQTCQYQTKHKGSLKNHLLIHKANSDVEMYQCTMCRYMTKRKGDVKRHLLVHRENTKVEMYECEACNYKTKRKGDLKKTLFGS
ncbi:hypothetical protein NQ317_011350 [Molorchus minor]|uniref:C2H2-type domain-containing protein n=1 Tax=Molorchus minor TaxID=1323400 RepID=A0ABQ9IX13_9CUCU|nr:hypothetical protein NQ317_011350 [Molorchus minor]